MDLNPIGEPYNLLVRLNDDTLPSPEAIFVTGITPQKTVEEGYTEAEFAKILTEEIFTPDTIAVGFNNVRFDDEFIRHLFWRNFHDAYEWSWRDGRSRWDILDVVRMTRALRPDGIEWPVDENGDRINRLELITKANGLNHENAHDALSDVTALIEVTGLLKENQPQLFDYLLKMRDKNEVKKLINLDNKQPFVYTSGRYDKQFAKTTVAFPLASSRNSNIAVYDLRYDPTPFLDLSVEELSSRMFASWQARKAEGFVAVPVKELQYNRTPAVAPLAVLSKDDGWNKIGLDEETIQEHAKILLSNPGFAENIRSVYESRSEYPPAKEVEGGLYDGFLADSDRLRVEKVKNADENTLADFHPEFTDERLSPLLVHYKARNYPKSLTETEMVEWESWRSQRLHAQLPGFLKSIEKIMPSADDSQRYLLQELQLWAESILPVDD